MNIHLSGIALVSFIVLASTSILCFTLKEYLLPRNQRQISSYPSGIAQGFASFLSWSSWGSLVLAAIVVALFGERP